MGSHGAWEIDEARLCPGGRRGRQKRGDVSCERAVIPAGDRRVHDEARNATRNPPCEAHTQCSTGPHRKNSDHLLGGNTICTAGPLTAMHGYAGSPFGMASQDSLS